MIYKKRVNGRLPDGRGAYILRAEIVSRKPIKSNRIGKHEIVHISNGLVTVLKTLDSIDRKLTGLSARISRIEKALGTGGPKPPARKNDKSQSSDKKQTGNFSHFHKIP